MTFRVTQKTLEALEWPMIVAAVADRCRTPQARDRLTLNIEPTTPIAEGSSPAAAGSSELFAQSRGEMSRLLAQTSEARACLDAERRPPLRGVHDVAPAIANAQRGALLEPRVLRDVAQTASCISETRTFMRTHFDEGSALAELAAPLADCSSIHTEIERCIDRGGDILDSASRRLAAARRETTRLGADLQARMNRYLQDSNTSPHLSDSFFTVRNDRYVLPVRADSRGAVRGIVHDASRSGTTLFIEPEGVLDLNNRLKQAELGIARERERILRELSEAVGAAGDEMVRSLAAMTLIDLAFARGQLSADHGAIAPVTSDEGILELPDLRHPLLPADECVANDLRLGADFQVLVLSGPNAGGKTVSMKSVGLAALCVRAGLHVAAGPGARVDSFDQVIAEIGDGQDMAASLSTFSAHMASLSATVRAAGPDTLIVLDEIGVGTDPAEGAALAQALLERLAESGARVLTTTHFNLLKEMAVVRPEFENASVEFDPKTLAPTYRIRIGVAGASSAATVAARMGMPSEVLERASGLMDREDRRLDQMLSELAANRATLEAEQERVTALRVESESARDDYRTKLEVLNARRDELYHDMRRELDASFKEAHQQIATVIRDLQRGATAQEAGKAKAKLERMTDRADEVARERGIEKPASGPVRAGPPLDWNRARPGDRVVVPGGRIGELERLPDARGRASVRVGGTRLTLPAERLCAASPKTSDEPKRASRVRVDRVEPATAEPSVAGGSKRCDLRGRRVGEALDELTAELDRAAADGCEEVVIVHGFGTGALRSAVREHLAESVYVGDIRHGGEDGGGDGVTIATLGRRSS